MDDKPDSQPADLDAVGPSSPIDRKVVSSMRHRLRWWVLAAVGVAYILLAAVALAYQVAGSFLWHILVFVILIAVFHVLFIWVVPFTKRDWKAVDYIWLAFTGLGVIGVVGESRRMQAEWERSDAHFHATHRFDRLKENLEFDTTYFCNERWRPRSADTVILPIKRDFPRTCVWLRQLATALPETLGPELPRQLDSGVPPPPPVEVETARLDIEETLTVMNEYRQQRERYLRAIENSEENGLEITLKLGGGLLLVFALALRITKVTGELRAE